MIRRIFVLIIILVTYGLFFYHQEKSAHQNSPKLPYPLPVGIQKTALGYLRQLGAELLYIKTAVFLGGREPGLNPKSYSSSLAQHFSIMSALHPEFVDTYYLCESSLSSIDNESTLLANKILENGMKALPDNWVLPFFFGFNHLYYLNESGKASAALYQASILPKAPPWLGHLAGVLAAEGGDIYGGLMWLKAMLANEEDEVLRERYRKDILTFEQAVSVQKAISEYQNLYILPPLTLDDLVPFFLPSLPRIEGNYVLSWTPPTLRLLRPKSLQMKK